MLAKLRANGLAWPTKGGKQGVGPKKNNCG